MELKAIKLAGFKSFVDPTIIPLEKRLTAIVGPNGCGKSNVVDAIRWVIGETSAKQLRGQSMSDVIFNGTTQRKPVGKASIELIFDNSDGKLGGEYARYNEISIRREVEREGQSDYFLNGSSCRRKDIIDLFLGTGLGPRSYSIIEQGMVSRLIEAKPEEMRVYIDEASGISKYKERRRETENRMRHTQENLDRLNDLREELAKQLAHLSRQASAAERYKQYKTEKSQVDAELKGLQWQQLQTQLEEFMIRVRQTETDIEAAAAELTTIEKNIEQTRAETVEANETQQTVQREYYGLGSEISALEQKIQFTQQRSLQWQDELSEATELQAELVENIEQYQAQVDELRAALNNTEPEAERLESVLETAKEHFLSAEAVMQDWQQRWEDFQAAAAKALQSIEIAKTKAQHFSSQLTQLDQRQQRLHEQKQQIELGPLSSELAQLNEQSADLEEQLSETSTLEKTANQNIAEQKQKNHEQNKCLNQIRENLQTARGQYASLEALQQSVLNSQEATVNDWLTEKNWQKQPKLAQCLQVAEGWEMAVETVLQGLFDAVSVNTLDEVLNQLDRMPAGSLTLMSAKSQATSYQANTLASKITTTLDLSAWLSGIYVAEDFAAAVTLQKQLASHESVITPQGLWLGANWLRQSEVKDAARGVLLREQQLNALEEKIEILEAALLENEALLEAGESALKAFELNRENAHQNFTALQQQWARLQATLGAKKARLVEWEEKQTQLTAELAEIADQITDMQMQRLSTEEECALYQTQQSDFSLQREQLLAEKENLQAAVQTSGYHYQQTQLELDRVKNSEAAKKQQLSLLEQTLQRDEKQLQQLRAKQALLNEQLEDQEDPLSDMRMQLDALLERRTVVETQLNEVMQVVNALSLSLSQLEKARQKGQTTAEQHRAQLAQLNMDKQAFSVRQQTIVEQLESDDLQLASILSTLSNEASIDVWQERSESLNQRINRLGPINLAAIDEHQQVSERKEYMDKQVLDLEEALKILETAIHKIDKETRTRFTETFDAVNAGFQRLFPKVFGGGQAHLELTAEDVLEAGILVKAQPPGKKNATIHMLSGGEKALTAIALVFSMFQLNPAPFCILDEVDAPLDEHNVGRFCQIVKEMAGTTQFIVISHNKVTMEMADQLMGVTMKEPGVSRIVSVAIDEAMELAVA